MPDEPARITAHCRCGLNYEWTGTADDWPDCPGCGASPTPADIDRVRADLELIRDQQAWEAEVVRRMVAAQFDPDIHRPNPDGTYPICVPTIGKGAVCERCGGPVGYGMPDRPCPAVPREQRWGPDWEEDAR